MLIMSYFSDIVTLFLLIMVCEIVVHVLLFGQIKKERNGQLIGNKMCTVK